MYNFSFNLCSHTAIILGKSKPNNYAKFSVQDVAFSKAIVVDIFSWQNCSILTLQKPSLGSCELPLKNAYILTVYKDIRYCFLSKYTIYS